MPDVIWKRSAVDKNSAKLIDTGLPLKYFLKNLFSFVMFTLKHNQRQFFVWVIIVNEACDLFQPKSNIKSLNKLMRTAVFWIYKTCQIKLVSKLNPFKRVTRSAGLLTFNNHYKDRAEWIVIWWISVFLIQNEEKVFIWLIDIL